MRLPSLAHGLELAAYRARPQGDRDRAVDLYAWTTVVSAAFYEPLQGLEIALRNALHGPVARCYGAAWYDNPAVGLDLGSLERVAKARLEIKRAGPQVSPPSRGWRGSRSASGCRWSAPAGGST